MLQMKKLSVALALCGAAALNATVHAADTALHSSWLQNQ